jgi:uncharacterized membrane protein
MRTSNAASRAEPDARVRRTGLDNRRLDTLIDGVFAIALTILVLDLRIGSDVTTPELMGAVHGLLPKIGTFVLAFATIAVIWVCHYLFDHTTVRSNFAHMLTNLPPLMAVVLIPFTAATFGAHPDSKFAATLYAGNFALAGVLYAIVWFANVPHVSASALDPLLMRDIGRAIIAFTVIEIIAAACAYISPVLTVAISAGIILVGLIMLAWIHRRIVKILPYIE